MMSIRVADFAVVHVLQEFSKTALTIFFFFCTKVPYYYGKNPV